MSDSNKKILLVLLGILFIAGAVFLVARPKNEKIKGLKAEISELQARYDDLCEKEKHKDEYLQDIADFNAHFEDVISKYASDLDQENTVQFLKSVEEDNDFVNLSISLPRETDYYILGQGAVEGEGQEIEPDAYAVTSDIYNISFTGSYEGVKSYLDYILNYKYRMAVESINISFAEDAEAPIAECTGSVTLDAYAVKHPDRKHDVPSVNVEEGKDNIFATEGENISAGAGSSTHDADKGESIVSDHTLVILLNNSDNDSMSGIIAASNESNESTYVTSNENKVEDLVLSLKEEDGKNYLTYSIGSKSNKVEVTSTDVTVYVKSSDRVDDNDKNGVNVKIENETSLAVYFKVAGDDSSNPRFKIGQKAGVVKEY
ncbi:MAG: hypothetical protein IJ749_04470 [Eubacterium sp.]|nr:hypothetical protein [Eubacterium sp.]